MKMILTEGAKRRNAPYSPGVIHNGSLYISGQLALNPETGKVPEGGIREHARQALLNLDEVLRAAGVPRENVIQCRVYTPDVSYWDDINAEYAAYFGAGPSARRLLRGGALQSRRRIRR